jgi:hypothetical protein
MQDEDAIGEQTADAMQDDDGRRRGRARVRAREPRGQVPDEEGHQRSSAVIRGHQRAEEGSTRAYQWSSEVIRGHQRAEVGGRLPVLEALLVVLAAGASEFQAHTPVHPPDEGGH